MFVVTSVVVAFPEIFFGHRKLRHPRLFPTCIQYPLPPFRTSLKGHCSSRAPHGDPLRPLMQLPHSPVIPFTGPCSPPSLTSVDPQRTFKKALFSRNPPKTAMQLMSADLSGLAPGSYPLTTELYHPI